MWKFITAAFVAALIPSSGFAQSEASGVAPISSISGGQVTAQAMLFEMKLANFKKDGCYQLGCLVVVNETQGYDLVGFYINSARAGAKPYWGRNRFQYALRPRKAALTVKTARAKPCELPVRFLLRHQQTRDEVTVESLAAVCTQPRMASVLRVDVLEPQVIWHKPAG